MVDCSRNSVVQLSTNVIFIVQLDTTPTLILAEAAGLANETYTELPVLTASCTANWAN